MRATYTILPGQIFGHWTVIGEQEKKGKELFHLCRCDCGIERLVKKAVLYSGKSSSCGCRSKEWVKDRPAKNFIDLSGLRQGIFTVLRRISTPGKKTQVYECLCECSNIFTLTAGHLIKGVAKSCGCLTFRGEDLTGQQFNYLTAIKRVPSNTSRVKWECSCVCGKLVVASAKKLKNGSKKSCGCRTTRLNDLTGLNFTRWTVLYEYPSDWRFSEWLCQCLCGEIKQVNYRSLIRNDSKSCGCLSSEIASALCKSRKGKPIPTLQGENNPRWKGGYYKTLKAKLRKTLEYDIWRFAIYARDGRKCTNCGAKQSKNTKLHAHHIIYLSDIVDSFNITTWEGALGCDLLWDISNGITLCSSCHKALHKRDGYTTR